jgi:hypothetical protein
VGCTEMLAAVSDFRIWSATSSQVDLLSGKILTASAFGKCAVRVSRGSGAFSLGGGVAMATSISVMSWELFDRGITVGAKPPPFLKSHKIRRNWLYLLLLRF